MQTIYIAMGRGVGADIMPYAQTLLLRVQKKYALDYRIRYEESDLLLPTSAMRKTDFILTGPLRFAGEDTRLFAEEWTPKVVLHTAICYPELLERSPLSADILCREGYNVLVVQPVSPSEEDCFLAQAVAQKAASARRGILHSTRTGVPNAHTISSDTLASQLLYNQELFDVLLTDSSTGPFVAGLLSELSGTPQMQARAYLGTPQPLIVEASSTFLDLYANKGTANPISAFLAVAMLLRHGLGEGTAAEDVEQAIGSVLAAGARTQDLAANDPFVANSEEIARMIFQAL